MSSRDKEKHIKKIRKRVYNSSSNTSSSRRYRFKRAILVGKKTGYTTPAPLWKTTTGSPSMANQHHHHDHRNSFGSKEKEVSVTARKLAATLWEINDLSPSGLKNRTIKHHDIDRASNLCRSESDPSYTPFSEVKQRIKGFEVNGCKRRGSDLSHHQLHLAHYYLKGIDGPCNADLIEKVSHKAKEKKNCVKFTVGVHNRLKEARSGLSISKKLLKVLSQMCLQEQNSSNMPLILAMSTELDHVRNQIDQLMKEQSTNPNDIEHLMNRFAEEKNAWKRKEKEKIREATMNIAKELEVEKKLRRQTERLNEKIAKEMENVKTLHLKMSKELEREKRAKEILEQICDELAKGIGEDRAQVEELKRESAKVREEVEKEREMLQLADVLREERVHMKLSEAKYQFEEKNAVLEKLRNELESFFKTKEEVEEKGGDIINPGLKTLKDLELSLNRTCWGIQNLKEENVLEREDESSESDLQSIELNMDNDSKSYKWSYACETIANYEAKRVSIDRDVGRRSISDWGSICFNKGNGNGKKWDFCVGKSDQLEGERSIEFVFEDQVGKDKEESEKSYRPTMSLHDYISLPNPALESGQPLTLQCFDGENVLVLEGHDLKQETVLRK